ncbi:MAG: response regulator [Chitinophagaceae bacterium]
MAKILVADDEIDLEMLIKQKFRRQIREHKYEFFYALNGNDALDKLKQYPDIDIVLSDINMPGMSGLELLRHIKQKYHEPPPIVMIITAYGDGENFAIAKELGADDFLTKPVDFTLLKQKLKIKADGKNISGGR